MHFFCSANHKVLGTNKMFFSLFVSPNRYHFANYTIQVRFVRGKIIIIFDKFCNFNLVFSTPDLLKKTLLELTKKNPLNHWTEKPNQNPNT